MKKKKSRPRRVPGSPPPAPQARPSQPPRRTAPGRGPVAEKRHRGRTEEMFHGLRACEAIFAKRPGAIVRVYLTEARRRQFAKLTEWCARERKGFQVVADDSLESKPAVVVVLNADGTILDRMKTTIGGKT